MKEEVCKNQPTTSSLCENWGGPKNKGALKEAMKMEKAMKAAKKS